MIPAFLLLFGAVGALGQSFEVIPSSGPFEGGNIVVFTNVVPDISRPDLPIHTVSIGGRLTRLWVDSPEIIDQGPDWVSFIAPPGVIAGITTNIRTQGTSVRSRIENQVYTYYPRGTIGSQTGRWRPVGQDFVPGSTNAIGMAGGVTRVRALHWDHDRNGMFAGGTFTNAGGIDIDGVAFWDATDEQWNRMGGGIGTTRYVNGFVPAPDGKVYAHGFFPWIGNSTSRNVGAWNEATQEWEGFGEGPTFGLWSVGNVNALHWLAPNNIIAVGNFTNISATLTTPNKLGCIARWDGTQWGRMDPAGDFRMEVHCLAVSPGTSFAPSGTLYVGGWFTNHYPLETSQHMRGMARWDEDASTWHPVGRGISGAARRVRTMMFCRDGNLYVGGNFTHAHNADGTEVEANRVAMWNGTVWTNLGEGAQGNGFGWDNVYDMAQCNDGYIYAVGDFTNIGFRTAGGPAANGFARWDGTNWSAVGAGLNHEVWTITINTNNNDIYVGGRFWHGLHEDGSVAHVARVARWDWDEPSHGVEPASGPLAGGYPVTISGRGLGSGTDITHVTLAGVPATIVSQSETQVVVTAGSTDVEGPGAVEVFSTTRGRSVKEDAFTYEAGQLAVFIPPPPVALPPGHGAMLWQDFETPFTSSNTPAGGYPSFGWSKAQIAKESDWDWATSGLNNQPSGARSGAWVNPTLGTSDRFARFGAGTKGHITRLFTPPVDMTRFTATPTMTFWHVQSPWTPDQDRLKVSYTTDFDWEMATNAENAGQSGATPGWQVLGYWDTAVSTWTERKIGLPDLTEHANVVFMFEGVGERGHGVGIDDLMVSGPMDGLPLSEQTVTNLWQDFETPWVNHAPAGGYPETGWSRAFVSNSVNWVQATNGLNRRPPGARPDAWVNPVTGTSNFIARLDADSLGTITRLFTPSLDFTGAQSVEMSFWHYQERWRFYYDWLRVRVTTDFNESMATNGSGVGWTTLFFQTNTITAWTNQVLSVPVSEVGPNTVFCFEFQSGYAYGVYLDDLKIVSDVLSVLPVASGTIALGEHTLSFEATFGGANPDGQTFTVSNSGEAEINWNGVGSKTWLTVTPSSGQLAPGASVEVTAQVDVDGLPEGAYSGHLIFVADEANNSAQLVDVALEVAKAGQAITDFLPEDASAFVTTDVVGLSATASSGLAVTFALESGPGSLSGGTNLTFTGAGDVLVVASQAGDANWEAAPSVTNTYTVNKAPAEVFLLDLTQTYDGMARHVTATTMPAGLTVEITYDGSVDAPTDAGSYAVTGTVNDVMYAGSATDTLSILKAPQTFLEFTPLDGSAFSITNEVWLHANAESHLPVTFSVVEGDPGVLDGIHLTFTNDGAVRVVASQAGDANWLPAPDVTNTYHVSKLEQTITFDPILPQRRSATTTVEATASSGLDVEFEVVSGPGHVEGTSLTYTLAGDVLVAARQPGNAIYAAAPCVTNEVKVFEVVPDRGPQGGGSLIRVTNGVFGIGNDITGVTVDGKPGFINAQGARWFRLHVPPGDQPGPVDIVVTSVSRGQTTLPGAFFYVGAGTITEVDPVSGSWTGNYEVVIQGTGLSDPDDPTDLTSVTLAGVSAAVQDVYGTTQVVVSAGTAASTGSGDVVVVSKLYGTTTMAGAFEYLKEDQTIDFPVIAEQLITNRVGLAATASSGLPVSFSVGDGAASIAGGTNLSFSAVGEVKIVAAQLGSGLYEAASDETRTFDVVRLPQTIDFPAIEPQPVTARTPLDATAESGLPVTYEVKEGPGKVEPE